ncbi:MAG: amino acid adenylation domain-containing protein [Lachnospiraceae bacterium]|nr:amino acid adenylation domain-containing protein [Lachnospiraceae bacterium]
MSSDSRKQGEEVMMLRSEELRLNKEEFFTQTFCSIFHKTALRYPDKTAVKDMVGEFSYRELDEYSNFLAKHLIAQGVGQEDIVAIQSGRQKESILAMLAIWKAGAAYVFVDDSYPPARMDVMQRECGYRIIFTEKYFESLVWERDEEFINYSKRDGLAILVYTSGSTSAPKGVMIEHKNVTASISNFHRLGFCETDRTCVFASFSFVASVYDIFSQLAAGGALIIIPEEIRRNIDLIAKFWMENQITVTFLPPHMAMKFMQFDDSKFSLRVLLVGSEPVRNLEPKSYRIINVYAASEMCSLISTYEIKSAQKSYPIGKLNETIRGYIVDEDGNQVKPGEEGELWLAGPQVTRGYFKRPELTKAQYMKNPFSDEKEYERLFKTRDIVCQMEDGNLKYISRKDNMFKIRGFRVEGGAVESAILKCTAIKEVVVKAFADQGGCNILCGYFVAEGEVDVKEVKEKLKEIIPYYMVPTCLIRVDQFPRNRNNKIDRNAIQPPKELNDHKMLKKLY